MRLNVVSDFSYTIETLISLGRQKLNIVNVPVNTNEKLRESRLFKSLTSYLKKSAATIIRIYCMYRALKTFLILGSVFIALGTLVGLRFLYFYFTGTGEGNIQSLILAAVFIIVGFQVIIFGLLADAIYANRKISEELLYRVKKLEYDLLSANFAKETNIAREKKRVI